MKQFIIFLSGLLSIIVGLSGVIAAIGAITTKDPVFIVSAIIFLVFWVINFIRAMKDTFGNKAKKVEEE